MIPFLNLQSLGAFALILGLLVLIHELGHFLVAKFLGIGVEVFSIGFGPRGPTARLARNAKLVAKSPCSGLAGRSIATSGSATAGKWPAA